MTTRPTGIVTFLLTDVEGSTGAWEAHPEAMARAMARHDAIVRAVVEAHGGYVFSTAGDAFAAAFTSATDAARAAVGIQRALRDEPWPPPLAVRVRIGLHTGAAVERDGDYFGPTVNRAARIMAAGHGGQVLASVATTRLLDAAACSLGDLGEHRLRDLDGIEHLMQIGAADICRRRFHRSGRWTATRAPSPHNGRRSSVGMTNAAGSVSSWRRTGSSP